MIIHTVKPGESVFTIAQRYGVPVTRIVSDNGLTDPNRLVIGQALFIPAEVTPHTVQPGQSLYSIARAYGVTLEAMQAANPQLANFYRIIPGQVVYVPIPMRKLGTITVNGYCFPNISLETLEATLPHLTFLSVFSHQVHPDGSLSTVNDSALIQAARAAGVAPLMVITNIEEGGGFSTELAGTILNSETAQAALLDNVEATLKSKNYYGLAIDFEYIPPEDREKYNQFVEKAAARLRPQGYIVTTALAPKTSAGQPGLLYEAHDYPVHGRLVDYVILMTYEWGYTYGPPLAVAPVNQVRRVLNYAVQEIPSEKILMGMPNYGYDWTLPYAQGTAARTLSNSAAVALAAREGANIQFDPVSQAPFFYYYDNSGRRHVVWFDDARSIEARLRLVSQYNLGGVSYWTVNRFFPQNWLVLQSLYDVRKVL